MTENLKFYILEFINLPWQIKSDERDSLYPFGFGWKSPEMPLTYESKFKKLAHDSHL